MINPDFRDMLSAFVEEGVEFLVVGAYAMAAHGFPRATGDLDFWVRQSSENAARILRALVRYGAHGVRLSGAWPNRLVTTVGGVDIPVISRDDLIRNKESAGRLRDLADVEELKRLDS